jgi:CRP-like cAMP-binding protein
MDEKVDILHLMETVIFLKRYTIFSALATEELRTLAFISKDVSVKDGQRVVRENDAGDSFFIIKHGMLRIVTESGGRAVELAVLRENECFGEMALFEEGKLRSASVYAKGDCTLLVIQKEDFFDAIAKHPGISIEMLKLFTSRLREANRKVSALSAGRA